MNVLIIGASRGIGLEFARQYCEAGDRVTATARDAAGLERLSALGAEPMKLDVTDPASVSGLSWKLDGEKLDLAIYVAGVFSTESAASPPTQQSFDRMMHTNVLSVMQALPQVAPWVGADRYGHTSRTYHPARQCGRYAAHSARFEESIQSLAGAVSELGWNGIRELVTT